MSEYAKLPKFVGSNEQPPLDASTQNFATSPRITYNGTLNLTIARAIEREVLSPIGEAMEDVKTKDASGEKAGKGNEYEVEEEEEEDDDEDADESGGEVDEYEDELRGIAESHEAMSRDERRNGTSSTTSLQSSLSKSHSSALRKFHLGEKSDEIMSTESSASNEAMPNEDEEVAELLWYKQKSTSPLVGGNFNARNPELDAKVKRVPTVKKELGTQKEILNGNETELSLPKTLVTSVDIANRLDDEGKRETRLDTSITSRDPHRYEHIVRGDTNTNGAYSKFKTSGDMLRKLDKRRPSDVNAPRSYYPDGYNSEQQLRRELQALGLEALADNLMELLSRLSEDPRLWERAHRILADLGGIPVLQKSFPDSQKRGYSPDSLLEMPLALAASEAPSDPATTKKPKKKKKKKKKLRQRLTNATSTYNPPTTASPIPPTPSTTASNWPATTQAQWRLVAERLFASPWSEEHRETSPTTKVLSIENRLTKIDDKQRVNLKALNDERQALMLQSAREYSQPRRLHYGKVNTHEKDSSALSSDDKVKVYDSGIDRPAMDYDLTEPRTYHQRPITHDRYDRYGHYARQRVRDYGPVEHERENDYDEIYQANADATNRRPFARTQQYRPLGSEYASAKTWQDSRYDYTRPWKEKTRTGLDSIIGTAGNWPWRSASRDYKTWTPRYQQPWPRDRNYWQRLDNAEDQLEEMMSDDGNENDLPPRNRQRQAPEQSWRMRHDDTGRWQVQRNIDIPWQIHERPKIHDREVVPTGSLDENKNRSELSNEVVAKPLVKEKPIVPKITMKTWNSLTSDPATWPFKLTGAKPWPKDKNGKSYNPNAELVRKLGLDKQDRSASSTKDTGKVVGEPILTQIPGKNKIDESTEIEDKRRNDLDTMITSVKNPINWPEKLAGVEEWRSKTGQENDRVPQREVTGPVWQTSLDNERKIWPGQSPVSPKISSVGAWVMPADQSTWKPYDLKHKVYGQVSADHRGRWNNLASPEDTDRRFWSSKNEGISGIWPQKSNDWNVIGSVYTPEKSADSPSEQSATWPSKWRQFTYHKVIASPLTKTGSLNNVDGSGRTRNSYIAVSAVSPPKYPNNEWRKNDIEENQLDRSSGDNRLDTGLDRDELSSQLRKNSGITNERWNDRVITSHAKAKDRNGSRNDPLEHQLAELRPHWKHELREQSQKRSVTSGNSSSTLLTTQPSRGFVKATSIDNEILKNHPENVTLTENQTHGNKNVTK